MIVENNKFHPLQPNDHYHLPSLDSERPRNLICQKLRITNNYYLLNPSCLYKIYIWLKTDQNHNKAKSSTINYSLLFDKIRTHPMRNKRVLNFSLVLWRIYTQWTNYIPAIFLFPTIHSLWENCLFTTRIRYSIQASVNPKVWTKQTANS